MAVTPALLTALLSAKANPNIQNQVRRLAPTSAKGRLS
jgi:hypothetical protein